VIEHSELTPLVEKIVEYRRNLEEMEGAQELIDSSDPEMRELAEMEYEAL
jgi:peptide chain release factor 1